MEAIRVERLDHLGLIAHMIQDLGLLSMIDARIVPDEPEESTPGEAIAGMILHGLGLANRPLSLPPRFCANKPLDLRLRDGVQAARFNRFQLGRTLDEVQAYGCDLLLSALALAVGVQEGMAQRFHHLDTTSFSLSGDDVPESDAQAMTIPHGSATDHRPDVKQAVLELMVSQDGGVPLVRQSWDGKASDTQIFQERAQALMTAFATAPTPPSLVADAQLSTEATAATRAHRGFIPRMPATLKLVPQVISPALQGDTWHALDAMTRYQGLELCHYGMAQRWLVVALQAALERAAARISKAQQREAEAIEKPLLHLQAPRFETPAAAQVALAALAKPWRDHQGETADGTAHKHYAGKGRPTPSRPRKAVAWQMRAQVRPDHAQRASRQPQSACFVLSTHSDSRQLSEPEVIRASTAPAQAEGGFWFLKAPWFFVSSLLVKKPCRIQGLLMVMTFALLVYAVTQRRLRHQLAHHNATLPHQINQPTARPTLRWVFQRLEGIHRVRVTVQGTVHDLIEGLNMVQIKILRLLGEEVCRLYQISPG